MSASVDFHIHFEFIFAPNDLKTILDIMGFSMMKETLFLKVLKNGQVSEKITLFFSTSRMGSRPKGKIPPFLNHP